MDEVYGRFYIFARAGVRFVVEDRRIRGYAATILDTPTDALAEYQVLTGSMHDTGLTEPVFGFLRYADVFDAKGVPVGEHTFLGEYAWWEDALDAATHN
jgi:hypothetical protein